MRSVLASVLLASVLLATVLVGARGEGGPALWGRREVRAPGGGRADLSCRADRLPAGVQLSWVRRPGLQVLWSGAVRFSAGRRVSARRTGLRHTLTVEQLRPTDAGLYECQLNTDPKASWTINLVVLDEPDPELEIWAESEGVRVKVSETEDGRTEVILPAAGGELRCKGRGELRWARGGREIQESSRSPCPAVAGTAVDPQCEVRGVTVRGRGRGEGEYSCGDGDGEGEGEGWKNITVRLDDPRTGESRWEDMLGDAAGAGSRGRPPSPPSPLSGALLISLVAIFL